MQTTAPSMIDPLGVFMSRLHQRDGSRPIPLISTSFDIAITAGLAVVTTTRVFRNAEAAAIEAMMTFPMPVHAALFALEARIDGRVLKAGAQRREAARETYENAIQEGKAAVLHEEVLRGIHMLSVANLRPGGEVEITTRWAAVVSFVEGAGQLRIPLTVGDVYGCSGLEASDDLVTGGNSGQTAQLRICPADGSVTVAAIRLIDGRAEIPMNRPIDLRIAEWSAVPLSGRAADGRRVDVTIAPTPAGKGYAAVAVLLDCSGSMSGRFGPGSTLTNHMAATAVVRGVGTALLAGDSLDLWEFGSNVRRVGALSLEDAGSIVELLDRLSAPHGGTETGRAVEVVAAGSEARDILLITDGKSYALDVQKLAGLGRRVSVLLIGEDSLEANVGHLAALTGGELFIAGEATLDAVARAMVAAIRTPFTPVAPISDEPSAILIRRGGVSIAVQWGEAIGSGEDMPGVSAMAAALAMPGLDEDRAAVLAEAEGLVTHLTSLVMVDEEGSIQEGVPSMRKIALDAPAMAQGRMLRARSHGRFAGAAVAVAGAHAPEVERSAGPARPDFPLRRLAVMIDWNIGAPKLVAGDVSALPQAVRDSIDKLAETLRADAASLGIDARLLVIALAARIAGETNRTAQRIARMLLDPLPADAVAKVLGELAIGP